VDMAVLPIPEIPANDAPRISLSTQALNPLVLGCRDAACRIG
jgi:hypothetical protein